MITSEPAIQIPVTHDEPVASVLNALQLKLDSAGNYVANSLPQVFNHVYGGQLIAQGLLAAAANADERRSFPHSLHLKFLRPGDTGQPVLYRVSELHRGRSFLSLQVLAFQAEKQLLQMWVSFQAPDSGAEFARRLEVPKGPQGLSSNLEVFRLIDNPVGRFLGKTSAFEVRHVDGDLYTRPQSGTRHRLWLRPRNQVAQDQLLSRALAAYALDQLINESTLRALGLSWVTPGMAMASLDHAMWFHRDLDINQWHLLDLECISAQSARGLSQGRLYTQSGELVATVTQECMLRVTADAGKWAFDGRNLES